MAHNRETGVLMLKVSIILLMILSNSLVNGQKCSTAGRDITIPPFSITWISQFPESDSLKRTGLAERISGMVFGKKSGEVVKPFNIVAYDPGSFRILDQGTGSLLYIDKGEVQPLKSMKKNTTNFPSLVGICLLSGGDMFFTDSRLNRVYRVSEKKLFAFADTISFQQPTGIACSEVTGEVWVVETAAHRITVLNTGGEVVKRIGVRGTGTLEFNFPTFIWIDSCGRVYVIDSMNFRIQVLDMEGRFLFAFGESGDATGNMARPKGVATDSYGNIYVADALFHVIQVFDAEGKFLTSFGGQGRQPGRFWMPAGIYIDRKDHIFVADSYNSRVQIFQLIKN